MIDNLKGHVIDNNVHAFAITNVKMFGLKDLVNFASASASMDRKIVIFAPQVSTHACAKFLSGN